MRTALPVVVRALGCLLVVALIVPASALAGLAREEQQGQRIAEAVRAGETRCAELSTDELELIGEYAMGRYLGNPGAHDAMNRHMVEAMGEQGERRMHVALGYRYSGCRGGGPWSWMGPMAGMMFGGRTHGGRAFGPGMMGGEFGRGDGFGMMDGGWWHGGGANRLSTGATIGVVAVLVAAAALAFFLIARRHRSPPGTPPGPGQPPTGAPPRAPRSSA